MNILYICVLVSVCMFVSYRRGLVRTLISLFSAVLAIFFTDKLAPLVSKALSSNENIRGGIYSFLQANIKFPDIESAVSLSAQTRVIENSGLPDFITKVLIRHNNPEVYKILRVTALEDYILNMALNAALNALAVIITFAAVSVAIFIAGHALRIISKIPVIRVFDKIGGMILGGVCAALFIWFFNNIFIFSVFNHF
ncbi:hypothetical protein AGMMS49975_11600 [Clostridia bacterium]|nr:hypothetical protein AGMMS49975_11600 [Clostridia bacterium]